MRYYIESGNRSLGPFEMTTVRNMLSKGTISSDTRISVDMVSWKRAAEFSELFASNAPLKPTQRQPAPPVVSTRKINAPPDLAPPPLSREICPQKEPKERIVKKPKGELSQKMSNRFLGSWLALSIGLLLGAVALLLLAIFYEDLPLVLDLLIQALILTSHTFTLYSIILALIAFWRAIPAELRRVSPDVAIGFLFVPLWQFYWLFVTLVSAAESMNTALDQRGLLRQHTTGIPTSLATGAAICLLVFPLQLVGIVLFYLLAAKMKKAAEHLEIAQSQ